MATLDSEKTKRSLLKKGFTKNNADHVRYEYFHNGKLVLHTKVSHGATHDLGDYLIKQMSVQCKLNKVDFVKLITCTISKGHYQKILKNDGLLD